MKINSLWDNFFQKESKNSNVNFLNSISIFEDLKVNEITRLERTLYTRNYNSDEIIFKENEPGAALYIIKEGKVNIYINYEKKPILITSLETGSFFGELAIFDESPRSATVVADKDTTLIALSKPDFMLFTKKEPIIGNKILIKLGNIISTRLRVANKQIEELKS